MNCMQIVMNMQVKFLLSKSRKPRVYVKDRESLTVTEFVNR